MVYNAATVHRLAAEGLRARLHLKVETGNHRQGLMLSEALVLADRIRSTAGLTLEGLSSHFANVEDATDHTYARAQIARFEAVGEKTNSVTYTHFDEALKQAQESERRYANGTARPLEGITVGIKDEHHDKGWVVTRGSVLLKDNREEYVAALVHADQTHLAGELDVRPLHAMMERLLDEQISGNPSDADANPT